MQTWKFIFLHKIQNMAHKTTTKEIFSVYCKKGVFKVNIETGEVWKPWILKDAVKACFNYWIVNEASKDMYDQYMGSFEELGGESYADWKGAVEEGIDAVMEYIKENKCDLKSGDFLGKVDITAVFEV